MNGRDSTRQKSSSDRKDPSRAVSISVAAWRRRRTAICSSHSATTSGRKSLRKNSTTTLARLSASRPTAHRPPTIWAYGLRNAQGLAFNPTDGKLWEQEHGPMGGDEINIMAKGKNYGWPHVSFGVNYDGTPVGTGKSEMDGVTSPIWHWTPSIAPSGMD